ncbi:MAG TPA: hypothetical protein VFK22_09195 [Candidatus Dormibacteraeota bacterium]|nr:hypothetical protein [Candidatus Dormibacteraeota bacterium]
MAAETQRRILLAESDLLLEDVETLRLQEEVEAPIRLREAIRALQIRLGRRNPPLPPATLDAAHDLVFAVQQRLMSANPNNPRPARHANRPSGQPVVTVVREDRKWKVLSLPPPIWGDEVQWMQLIESTVERALDRWCYAHHQAVRAARLRTKPLVALALEQAAWDNYWLLVQDADRIRARLAAETHAARRP